MKIYAHSLNKHKVKSQHNRTKVRFTYDPDGRDSIESARLIGSWSKDGNYSKDWSDSAQVMTKLPDGRFQVELPLNPSHHGKWQFGIMADGPAGRDRWAIMEESNPEFELKNDRTEVVYRPTNLLQKGVKRQGEDVRITYWAPHAQKVTAVFWQPNSKESQSFPLEKNEKGQWQTTIPDSWSELEGKAYAYSVTNSQGETALRVDPYARQRMGPQRGVDDIYLHAESGQEVHKFHPDKTPLTRFEVQEYPDLAKVRLILSDESGKTLGAEELQERLGSDQKALVAKYHGDRPSDYWSERLKPDGSIELLPQGKAFATILPEFQKLEGMQYRFEGFDENGKLLGDLNRDGTLQAGEASKLSFNDPFSTKLEGQHRSQRFGLVEKPSFEWKHDNTPRLAQNPVDQVVYQIHPGSIFGSHQNVTRSSFKDIIKRLDYFKDLGVNVLELMPVNSFEGSRDWGYIGSHNMAITENYGFTDEKGQWVQGDEALKRFVDAAHSKGLKVFNDVVYNHFGGDHNNVWNVGGPENPWFEWSDNPKSPGDSTKQTPWGALPAYNKEEVRDYITNHALNQLDEFHFDGLRFDFTHPIHAQGENGGGTDGWEMLQKINRTIKFFHPEAFIAAEEFPNHPVIVKEAHKGEQGGAGFDAMWNTEFQHRLVHDHGNPSVLQEAAHGHHTRIDKLMNQLVHQPGFAGPSTAVTVLSNHDEVGNADRILNVANLHRDPSEAGAWEKSVTRTSTAIGLLSPGTPIFFQGDESMATNKFSWGTPSTWDLGWEWENRPDSPRYKHHQFTKALLKLRNSSSAFQADAAAHRVYTHEQDSVLAFSRKKDGEEYLVVSSFNKSALRDYRIPTDGRWEQVLSSDDPSFGGEGVFTPRALEGQQGTVDLPAGGTLVLKRTS